MKILLVDYAGHPFQYDLAAELASRGHDVVHTYSTSTLTPHAGFETVDGVAVEPVDIGRPFDRYRPLRRLRDEISYGARTVALARRHRPDQVLASNVPVVSLAVLSAWAFVSRTPWVLWLQDIQAGLAGMVTGSSGVVARSLGLLERFVIRRAPRIVAISDAFGAKLDDLGVPPDRVTVIENWAPVAELPLRPRNNEWSRRHRLDEVFVFLYSGTLGMKHSPGLLIELAREFAAQEDVEVVVVGGGAGADWLGEQPEPRPVLLPFQAFADLPDVLGSADVLVALLDQDAGAFSVPSKTLTYLCAARPILAAVPKENAAAEVVADRAQAGVVVPPSDSRAFRAAARALYSGIDHDRAGERAREYAVSTFDRRAIGDRFEVVLSTDQREGEQPGND